VPEDLSPELRATLARTSVATLTTQLFKRGFRNAFVQGVRRLSPDRPTLVGPATTVRFIPCREDLSGPDEYADRAHPQRRAVEECPPGGVIVMDCRRDPRSACAGDIMLTRMELRRVAGLVTDGGIRDTSTLATLELPVFAATPSAPASFHLHTAVDLDVPIACGGVPVYPGDVVVGDADGVVVIPRHLVDEIARDALEQERLERFVLEEIRSGRPIFEVYPPDDATRARYQAWRGA
jgi:regulator of RNase E activity RraA